jgi:D-beta-D-heptose 7-phosphate kinase/D-beta-D-heptose 1-phosphate adenosyltransferase
MTLRLPMYEKSQVLVVGDVMLDRYWQGSTRRISPEAPVPIVKIEDMRDCPGAAANVALNIRSLNGNVSLLSMTGDDSFADKLEKQLKEKSIQTLFQRIKNIPTISKLRVLSQHQQLIRLDFEEGFFETDSKILIESYKNFLKNIPPFEKEPVPHLLREGLGGIFFSPIIVLSDYAKGVLKCAPELIKLARENNIPVFIDPKGDDFTPYRGASLLTPNRKEFEIIVGKCQDENELVEKALKLIQYLNLEALLITRGEEGMSLIVPNQAPLHLSAKKQEIFDVTGAGDTVIGVLAASISAGLSLQQAVVVANLAAGIVVSKLGAATVSPHELRRGLQEEHNLRRGVVTEDSLLQIIEDAHAHGETVVMSNGCFDILHPGHITYLEEAKNLGDHLIVAVNDDASVKRLKGENRPVNSLEHRMAVLAGLSAVDWVISFSEDTPEKIISKLLPDILVKGGDYKAEDIAGGKAVIANGGLVKILSFVEGHSTTSMLEKIQKLENFDENR